jgi:hypothetical protein
MTSTWLPTWLTLAWAAVFAGILLVHAWHLVVLSGRRRLWHGVHVLMASGMLVMFVPTGATGILSSAAIAAFLAAAATVGCLLARERVHRRALGPLWFAALVDLAAMAYMLAMTTARLAVLTLTLLVWFAAQATGWITGRLCVVLAHNGLGKPAEAAAPVDILATGTPVVAAIKPGIIKDNGAPVLPVPPKPREHAHQHVLRVSLGLMALGVAYMLIVMQWSMTVAPAGMSGM